MAILYCVDVVVCGWLREWVTKRNLRIIITFIMYIRYRALTSTAYLTYDIDDILLVLLRLLLWYIYSDYTLLRPCAR